MVLSLHRFRDHPQPVRIIGLGLALALNLTVLLLMSLPGDRRFEWPAPAPEPKPMEAEIVRAQLVQTEPVPPMPTAPAHTLPQTPPSPAPVPPVTVESTALPVPFEPLPPVAAPTIPGPVEVAIGTPATQVGIRRGPPPRYPGAALRRGLEGLVLLRVHVGSDGMPRTVEIAEGSGHVLLDREAREHVLQRWQFHPAQVDGRAVEAWVEIPIEFSLRR